MVRRAGVNYILDTVIQALKEDPDKKFSYSEIAFFTRWWDEQTEDRKEEVRALVKNGQLQFVGGGWSQEDEACTNYEGIITNMQRGHGFLKSEFNYTVRTAWQIDAYGHSRSHTYLMSKMGLENLFFARMDYRDKE